MDAELKWSKTPPTEPGFYWATQGSVDNVELVEYVVYDEDIGNEWAIRYVARMGTDITDQPDDYIAWLGPIPVPAPPDDLATQARP